jgi:hypothetical protein
MPFSWHNVHLECPLLIYVTWEMYVGSHHENSSFDDWASLEVSVLNRSRFQRRTDGVVNPSAILGFAWKLATPHKLDSESWFQETHTNFQTASSHLRSVSSSLSHSWATAQMVSSPAHAQQRHLRVLVPVSWFSSCVVIISHTVTHNNNYYKIL